ncbi:Cytochrome c2 [Beijerinckiaceae bacterium RH AL1]|jgi:cytochrome c|nr:c-type cytochrome [Beijerinckiaceae bacterium]VVB49805.1 Cytochrome c2 [Beijerinckiaceae bacterium RH CH11]VVB49882.1 Cytochrome c2 [Beijerinckiaceae bacterium RH AL8]VVC57085.1 Cytochrome c2 [Beijerinckiaceae bacterium RH AL1]
MKGLATAVIAAGLALAWGGAADAQDAAKGETTFKQCGACHALDHAVVGPPLGGVVGRKAGSVAGYNYSPLMKAAGDAGLVWTDAAVVDYLKNPTEYLRTYLKGKGKDATGSSMMYYMLADETQRKNVAAYLAQQK